MRFTCEKSILAIGTNDAMYGISDEQFVSNLKQAIAVMRSLGTKQIILIPAFYSTLAASYNPKVAGTIARVDEINVLIERVAVAENVPVESQGIQALFKESALNADLTIDGVHLNAKGLDIYRKLLLNILIIT
ncbi:SGNH/GDSL hydrolase family protein [Microcoleus sp. T2B6]|uniref:SGNH/GDSL hydrolase family protein n=1 Tax=Microcoleus sp. T2B6 TaxID=3055424 RepID=UPI002FD54621